MRGYDESHPTYGYDDIDFYNRCRTAGFAMGYVHNCQCLSHSDEDRMQFYPQREKAEAMRTSTAWLADTSKEVNPKGYGRR